MNGLLSALPRPQREVTLEEENVSQWLPNTALMQGHDPGPVSDALLNWPHVR